MNYQEWFIFDDGFVKVFDCSSLLRIYANHWLFVVVLDVVKVAPRLNQRKCFIYVGRSEIRFVCADNGVASVNELLIEVRSVPQRVHPVNKG